MSMAKANIFSLVYGNHGVSPVQIEDYLTYLVEAFARAGINLRCTEKPIPGAVNILLECFDENFYFDLMELREKAPDTKFVCVCTEFVSNSTFNDFEHLRPKLKDEAKSFREWCSLYFLRKIFPLLFPIPLRRLVIKMFPFAYRKIKKNYYYKKVGFIDSTSYNNPKYWRDRYRFFLKVADICEEIWCVSPHQVQGYVEKLGAEKIRFLPIVPMGDQPGMKHSNDYKDIDFLFTGSITPYRDRVLTQLTDMGYNVVAGSTKWPSYVRDHFIRRTKVNLHIRQTPEWPFPSIMRFNYLLSLGCTVVAEESTLPCAQDPFLVTVKTENFVNTCIQELAQNDFAKRSKEIFTTYRQASDIEIKRLVQIIGGLKKFAAPADRSKLENSPPL